MIDGRLVFVIQPRNCALGLEETKFPRILDASPRDLTTKSMNEEY